MSAYILLNLLNELKKKMRGLPSIFSPFRDGFKNPIVQKHECKILFITWHYNYMYLK